MAENNWELELNEYIRQGEPDKVDKSNAVFLKRINFIASLPKKKPAIG